MIKHPRLALPTNTPSSLNELRAQGQVPSNCTAQKEAQTNSPAIEVHRNSTMSKFAQKMKGLFMGEKTKPTLTEEEEAEANERKRTAAINLVGMNGFLRPQ